MSCTFVAGMMSSTEPRHYPPPPRRPYLRFPPPPPYPPGSPADYAYAYYEPGPSTSKHTFITRYGTEENIYEEIGASQIEEEVRYVHSRHLQVLGELNLTVEAMLMPSSQSSGKEEQDEMSVGPTDELLSPATCSLDSGFSGSSTGTNSLGRNQFASAPKAKKQPPFWKKLSGMSSSPSPAKEHPKLIVDRSLHGPCLGEFHILLTCLALSNDFKI